MNEEQTKKAQQQWAKVIAKAWADEDFKARLIADPAGKLKAEGIEVPDGMTIKVVENTDKLTHIVIPLHRSIEIESLEVRSSLMSGDWSGSCMSGTCSTH